jgi:hypothetical protein
MSSVSRRWVGGLRAVAACGMLGAGLVGCTATAPPPPPSISTDSPGVPASASPGRTAPSLIPTGETRACAVLDAAELKEALGTVGASMKDPEPSGIRLDDGFEKDTCVYPLDADGVTTNAVVMEVIWDTTGTRTPSLDELAPAPEPEVVEGLGSKALYSMVRLSGSSEYSLSVESPQAVYRLLVARPNSADSWDRAEGRDVLERIMRKAKL